MTAKINQGRRKRYSGGQTQSEDTVSICSGLMELTLTHSVMDDGQDYCGCAYRQTSKRHVSIHCLLTCVDVEGSSFGAEVNQQLSCRRGTARRALSGKILSTAVVAFEKVSGK